MSAKKRIGFIAGVQRYLNSFHEEGVVETVRKFERSTLERLQRVIRTAVPGKCGRNAMIFPVSGRNNWASFRPDTARKIPIISDFGFAIFGA